ncbi:hypothetical protein PHLGIDRAFT_14001 [Phlebiopsis gigantea 11061_1 CR5-6]|uniref:NAD-P-binding protein n=1 Tax=Phlebiopsis gigantea (strain 11061_1 CR5-6) TaxID=745531 RepID=A0A0C3S6K7_PHLG1|nr:hypothetical protein PHLGIDRAFT_14001 [Phlebiopsis gigantea 11061_1 CR5-6]
MDENLDVTQHHSVYPAIRLETHASTKTYRGKVVLVTGASRGIGEDVARHYALAGAAVVLVARHLPSLEQAREAILRDAPDAQILALAADVTDWVRAEEVVAETVERFGRLDVLVANAGASTPMTARLGEKDPVGWWATFEVNVRGVFNFVRAAIAHLERAHGYVLAMASGSAQLRFPHASDYGISKHALNRLVEYVVTEYPAVKAFAVHPGVVDTQLSRGSGLEFDKPDPTELAACTMLHLTSGRADWLSGRYVCSNWDLGDVEREWKDRIVAQNGLVNKLHIPR